MALIGNYSVLTKNPGRAFGGSTVSDTRANWTKSGAVRGRYCASGGFSALSGVPNGYRPPGSWQIAIKPGALSSTNAVTGAGALAGSGLMGVAAVASLAGTGDLTAVGALVVAAIASLAGSGDLTADLRAVLAGAASLAGSGDLVGAMAGLGWAVTTMAGSGAMTITPYATGTLAAAILPYTDLSPEALAASVWSSAQGAFLHAMARNRVVTDPVAGTITVYAEDDATVLYSAPLWQDAAGTTPYAGAGAERRDRLA